MAPRPAALRALGLASLLAFVCVGCGTTGPDPYDLCDDPLGGQALEQARQLIVSEQYELAAEQLRASLAACPERVRTHLLYVEVVLDHLAGTAAGETAAVEMRAYYRDSDDQRSPVWPYLRARLAEHDAVREDWLEEALARDDRFHWAYLSLARLWRGHGRLSRALTELNRALEARPDFPDAGLELAEVLAELGRFEESAEHYANYLRQRPGDRTVLRQFSRVLIYELGRTEEARPIVQRRLDDDPESVEALMDMAALAWKEGDYDVAVGRYRQVLDIDRDQELAALNLGNLHYDVLWLETGATTKRESWALARKAYLYYLEKTRNRTSDRYAFWDHHFAVPARLREIEKLLGRYAGRAPEPGDF